MKVLSARSVGHARALSSACVFIPVRVQPLHFACICGSRLEGLRVRCSSCRHSFPYHKCYLVEKSPTILHMVGETLLKFV